MEPIDPRAIDPEEIDQITSGESWREWGRRAGRTTGTALGIWVGKAIGTRLAGATGGKVGQHLGGGIGRWVGSRAGGWVGGWFDRAPARTFVALRAS